MCRRELSQKVGNYWTAPPTAIRICVLESAPVFSAIIPNSIVSGTVMTAAQAKKVGLHEFHRASGHALP